MQVQKNVQAKACIGLIESVYKSLQRDSAK